MPMAACWWALMTSDFDLRQCGCNEIKATGNSNRAVREVVSDTFVHRSISDSRLCSGCTSPLSDGCNHRLEIVYPPRYA
jgi:hypothetical protein